MNTTTGLHIAVPNEAQLLAASYLPQQENSTLLGHLRWHHATPYAIALVAHKGEEVAGFITAVFHGSTGRFANMYVDEEQRKQGIGRALVMHAMAVMEAQGLHTQTVQAPLDQVPFFERLGFISDGRFLRYGGGLFIQATRDEVVLIEPAHTLALLHLDKQATGEDRGRQLMEHRYVAQAYVEDTRVRGGLFPLLGHGLILAEEPYIGLELQRWLLPTQNHIVLPEANRAACAHLAERQYQLEGMSMRMVRGARPRFRAEMVFAWAG